MNSTFPVLSFISILLRLLGYRPKNPITNQRATASRNTAEPVPMVHPVAVAIHLKLRMDPSQLIPLFLRQLPPLPTVDRSSAVALALYFTQKKTFGILPPY